MGRRLKAIACCIIKGGTGKTTTAAALAQAAHADGKRVLCIDMDPQGDLTSILAGNLERGGAYHLLHGAPAADTIEKLASGLDLIGGSVDLAAEVTKTGSSARLRKALDPVRNEYDYIIIDTPPEMGELTFNALAAASHLLITTEADDGGLQGLYKTRDIAATIQERVNPDLSFIGTVITRYDGRPKINRFYKDAIETAGEDIGAPLAAVIRQGSALKEAQALRRDLYQYAGKSKPAADYMALYKAIEQK